MSIQDIVACCPWKQAAARDYTTYELSVAHQAIADGMTRKVNTDGHNNVPLPAIAAEAAILLTAIVAGPCTNWKQGVFSPGPAVPILFYYQLGYAYAGGYAALSDPLSRGKFRDAVVAGMLCKGTMGSNIVDQAAGYDSIMPLEGAIQRSSFMAPSGTYSTGKDRAACQFTRANTRYVLVKGRDILTLLGGLQTTGSMFGMSVPLPPQLTQLIAMAQGAPAAFLDREFILGFQMRPFSSDAQQRMVALIPTLFAGITVTPQTGGLVLPKIDFGTITPAKIAAMTQLVSEIFEDVAAIWAPGLGFSLMPFLSGAVDPVKLLAMATSLGIDPNMMTGLLSALPPEWQTMISQQLPQLATQFGGLLQQFQQVFGGGGAVATHGFGADQPEQPTGSRLLDTPEAQLNASPGTPPPLPTGTPTVDIQPKWYEPVMIGLAIFTPLALLYMISKPRETQFG